MLEIPLDSFDQSKLEQFLRKAPSAFVREEKVNNFQRKHYQFPREAGPIVIKCHGDHFENSPLPSDKKCTVRISARASSDEVRMEVPNTGLPTQKLYSTERVYGQGFDGKYRQLFRYMFECTERACKISFATIP